MTLPVLSHASGRLGGLPVGLARIERAGRRVVPVIARAADRRHRRGVVVPAVAGRSVLEAQRLEHRVAGRVGLVHRVLLVFLLPARLASWSLATQNSSPSPPAAASPAAIQRMTCSVVLTVSVAPDCGGAATTASAAASATMAPL